MNQPRLRPVVVVLLIVALVVTSGCSAFDGGSGDQNTEPDGESEIEGPLPPGVDDSGEANTTVILNETSQATASEAVRLDHRNGDDRSMSYLGPGGLYSQDEDGVDWVNEPTISNDRQSSATGATNDTITTAEYSLKYVENSSLSGDMRGVNLFALAIRLGTGDYEYSQQRTVDGTRLHELEMVDTEAAGDLIGHYTGTMLVDTEGRIHRLWGEIGENESSAEEYEWAFDWSVESVPEPAWLDDLPRGTAAQIQNDTVFRVTVTDGPAIPADSTFEFSHGEISSSVTLEEPLGPGETLSLAIRREDDGVVSSRGSLAGEFVSLRDDRTELEGTVTVENRSVELSFSIGRVSFLSS